MALRCLDLEAFGATRLTTEPFAYLVVPGFVRESARDGILADYPSITERGSFPVSFRCLPTERVHRCFPSAAR